MENNEIMNDIIEETMTEATDIQTCSGKDLGLGMLIGGAIVAAGYGAYKGIKFLVKKAKAKKEQRALEAEAIEVHENDIEVK